MERGRNAQYGALAGVVAVVLIIVGFAIFTADIPSADEAGPKWAAFFTQHQDRIQTGITIVAIGALFFIWFLGSLRDTIAGAEPGSRLASIAFGGGLVGVAILGAGTAGLFTAALHPLGYDPNLLRSWADFAGLCGAPAAAGFTALFTATAVAGYRHGAVPAAIAGISATAAIGQVFAFFVGATDHGAFAPDGFFGVVIPFITFAVGVLALSITLYRQAGQPGAAARATT